MDVKAINGLSASSFQGRTQHPKKEKQIQKSDNNYNSQPMYNSSKAMRNLVLGLMALGATAGTITSCDDDATASASASASYRSSRSLQQFPWHYYPTGPAEMSTERGGNFFRSFRKRYIDRFHRWGRSGHLSIFLFLRRNGRMS